MADRFLMCAPHHFEVAYVINPWMEGNIARCRSDAATTQWNALAAMIGEVAHVETIAPAAGVPDLVFTANAGLVLGDRFVLSRFRHPERQKEEPHFARWFDEHGFKVLTLPPEMSFEGAGDALLDRQRPLLWMGHGHRTHASCEPLLEQFLDIEVEPLQLVNDRFYHLDTCFCPLEGGYLMYYPAAFDAASQARIAAHVPVARRIAVADEDAFDFACNAVNSGRNVFLNRASDALVGELQLRGFVVRQTGLSEFMKAGGSAKCLTLKLNEERWPLRQVA
ncbi:nitrate reductase [Noviherbaspirillum cavernae]|uniref:arginine deiminase n=1 Tax=Noviherbaspirillum cavernae TaxID=2320862 RepID=A0A418WXH8_9BURK|nr:arginine deiminase-related protein [Noviherbaspirillum cavernae]RJG04795.1 nitrate reductase [Noviherbaspirillum cavernae]